MVNDPTRDDELLPVDASEQDDPPEDEVIERSMKALASMSPPADFVAEVMYQVRETHLRKRLDLGWVAALATGLFLMVLGLFLWDVRDYAQANDLDRFGPAFTEKSQAVTAQFDGLFEATGGILTASWQFFKGFLSTFLQSTPWPLQILIFAGILALFWLVRKWLF